MSPINLLTSKADELLGTLVEPIWRRILALSWLGRFAVLLVMLGLTLGFTYREQATASAEVLANVSKVFWAQDSPVPLNTSLLNQVHETASRIAITLAKDVDPPAAGTSPWAIAQATAASHRLIEIDRESLAKFFRDSAEPSCRCWKEIPDQSHPLNIPVTAWVIFALAEINKPATSEEITFLLNEQQSEGWWSVFPIPKGYSDYASSYATAWAVLALHNQLAKKLISDSDAARAREAVSRGASWLLTKRGEAARWKDYPQDPAGKISESISALVVYALHSTTPNGLRSIEKDWLDNLPSVPSAGEAENDYHWVGNNLDAFVQIKLPWMLIATASAYQSGGILL